MTSNISPYPYPGAGNPVQYSCLGNPMDGGAWLTSVHGVAKSHNLATKQQLQGNVICVPKGERKTGHLKNWIVVKL